ncbi:hypothetical protein BGZ83_010628 [Gryganskiella cystojenkinii]|nr:hypothetical protein BGZ83_010628 [Gryganskiella cystojenkinii]
MFKKLGLVNKDHDTAPSTSSFRQPIPSRNTTDDEKFKIKHNKKVLKATASMDSLDSVSIAPRPHLPSSVYNPNPFPLDPTLPGGLSQFKGFVSSTHKEENLDIEVEERRGFVSGKSRQSIEQIHESRDQMSITVNQGDDVEYELTKSPNPIQRFKGAFAKSKVKERQQYTAATEHVDAVLQHHLQLQEQQMRSSQQQDKSSKSLERERGRQRTSSGPSRALAAKGTGISDGAFPPDGDRPSRPQSLSPPPLSGQERTVSGSYWPKSTDHDEQMSPFLGYQPPRRPLSQTSDSDGDFSRFGRDGRDARYHSRERAGSDRMRREVLAGGGGARRQSGLNNIISPRDVGRTSSELGTDDEQSAIRGRIGVSDSQEQVPDRLSRAKEWVATHSKNNSVADLTAPEPVAANSSRPVLFKQRPESFPTRAEYGRRPLSLDVEAFGMVAPYRDGYYSSPGSRFESRDRMAMEAHMQMQGSMRPHENDRYWGDHLEGYENDRYHYHGEHWTKEDLYRAGYQGMPGGYYRYPPGGPDDADDEDESTLAPGSTAGGVAARSKKVVDTMPDEIQSRPTDGDNLLRIDKRVPSKRRLVLRMISLGSSLLCLVLLVAAAPVSHSSSPFSTPAGLIFHYVVAILSTLVSCAFVFNYFARRLHRQEKMKRYIYFGLDIVMALAWMIDVFVCIKKFPCAVGGQNGWCDMYNSSVFLGIVTLLSFLAAFVWDIWGSFDHSKITGNRPLMRQAPPGWDGKPRAAQGAGPGRGGGQDPRAFPGAMPGAVPGTGAVPQGQRGILGQSAGQAPQKKSKALW